MRFIPRDDLEGWRRELLEAAERASRTAHCEYSKFPVGAALKIRTPEGEERVVLGNNYELATYRSICAERHALHRAYADHSVEGPNGLIRPEVTAVAVYCEVATGPQQPCGVCRQALHEVNPEIEVIGASGPDGGSHDTRVTLTNVRSLLPHGFDASSLEVADEEAAGEEAAGEEADSESSKGARIVDPEGLEEYIVHLPKPSELAADAASRAALLEGVQHLIVVGSPRRARRIAELAHQRYGARHDAAGSCYCDLTVPGRDESSREYVIYGVELPNTKLAVASHGIGKAGVEIVLSELPALIALIQGAAPELRGVLRCGTRGTLSRAAPGAIALSTRCHDERLAPIDPSPYWLDRLRAVASERGMTRLGGSDVDSHGDWSKPSSVLAEGPGISTSFFWHGQSRPVYRVHEHRLTNQQREFERRQRAGQLSRWVAAGVKWIEMEDFTVLRVAEMCGIPAASLGAVLAQRQQADGTFQLDYSKRALAESELIPSELALEAILSER
ncbi:MAG: hypothetical protein AAF560_13185 [Acidobacteriota bacterium]